MNKEEENNIIKVPIEDAMPDNYLPYAVEVAKDRALPDVRDGLKPVQRRILYGSYMLKAFPDKPYYKSARIVGDILGKYHPHGDASVYDAMVILAQRFTTRQPLIDGHGNWGSVDGDSAAAMRYTEARLTPVAIEMLRDIEKNVVNMVNNYSDSEKEPEVLPGAFPNLLVNGTFGIAVGLATNIPPHNLGETINGLKALIHNENISTKELMKYVKGPDLPTGGIIIGGNSLLSSYETGEGKVVLRAKTSIEKLENGKLAIVITEFPYRKNKARILQNISEMTADKKHEKMLEPISDIRDESDRKGIRAVIEFKKSADEDMVEKVLKYLFKKTDLQCSLSFNMVALNEGKPETMGLKRILSCYLKHREQVVYKRTEAELAEAKNRFIIVEGFIKAIDIIDEIIATIRSSKSKADSIENISKKYGFNQIQAEAIVSLMLYRLTNLEIKSFEKEYKELAKKIKEMERILKDKKKLMEVIENELTEVDEKYSDSRRTRIIRNEDEAKIEVEEIIVDEDVMVTASNDGFIKRIPLKSYNRSNTNVEDIEYREGDYNKFLLQSNTKNTLVFFTDKGNMYQTGCINVGEKKWKDKGERVSEIIKNFNLDEENICSMYSIDDFDKEGYFIFILSDGVIKKSNVSRFKTNYTKLMAAKMKDDERLCAVIYAEKDKKINLNIKTKWKLDFDIELPELNEADRPILGAKVINVFPGDEISESNVIEETDNRDYYCLYTNEIDRMIISTEYMQGSMKVSTSDKIIAVGEDGEIFNIDAAMLGRLNGKFILSDIPLNIKVADLTKVDKDYDGCIYIFTEKGEIKKTPYENIRTDFNVQLTKIKLEDRIISAARGREDSVILMASKKGMALKFKGDSFTSTNKGASTVNAMRLGKDDLVLKGFINLRDGIMVSTKGFKKAINISDIPYKNKGTKGIEIIPVLLDDYVNHIGLL